MSEHLLNLMIINYNKGLHKEVIYDMLWKNYDIKSARNNFNVQLSHLRKILGIECINSSGNIIQLNNEKCWIDIMEFEQNIQMGKQAIQDNNFSLAIKCLQIANELYKDDFIANDLYTDFIISERNVLKKKYRYVLHASIKLYLNTGSYPEALGWARRLIQIDPDNESGYRLLMISCMFTKNRSELPKLYKQLNDHLKNEFGIEADPTTKELMGKFLRGIRPSPSMWQDEQLL